MTALLTHGLRYQPYALRQALQVPKARAKAQELAPELLASTLAELDRTLVGLLKGRIQVSEGARGIGSTFEVILPGRQIALPSTPTPTRSHGDRVSELALSVQEKQR